MRHGGQEGLGQHGRVQMVVSRRGKKRRADVRTML
jgi:hypothetical protein